MEESIPFKYLLTKEQRFRQFKIVGQNGNEGSFYVMQNGYFDSKFCIEHMGKVYLGYSIDKGRNNYVSIYDGDRQIVQITKPFAVIDNLEMTEQSSAQAKKIVKLVGVVFLVLILFAIVLFVVLKSTLG